MADVKESRVNQLDAAALDEELLSLLCGRVNEALKYFKAGLFTSIGPELQALLKLVVWKLTLYSNGSTIGQNLLNLEYKHAESTCSLSSRRAILFAFFTVGLPWLKERLEVLVRPFVAAENMSKVRDGVEWIETTIKLGNMLNFLIFLQQGKYCLLSERVLHIRNMSSTVQPLRQVQYEYMNRELLWHGFAEFLTFVLPLINVHRMKNILWRFIFSRKETPTSVETRTYADAATCAVCKKWPIIPHDIGCRHVYCYYCISSNVLAEEQFRCPSCGVRAKGMNSLQPVSVISNPLLTG
ncbi:peroxisome biogenesis factor 2-like [Limulus polyphemus]|uniref:Peroxisome biogenesis factor 2 n=1 Tax=Limulus polyphemus TaxID=6850 RepID=A0ABM1B923_LIMPO|nr:peroxisome biogenesis factor 2-like [Limulus polyphemus]